MKKYIRLSVLVIGIMIVGGFGCANNNADDNARGEKATQKPPTTSQKDVKNGMTGPFGGRKQKCTYKNSDGEEGTIYTDGKRVYAEVRNAPVPGETGENVNMINDGSVMYTWDIATKKGQKISLADMKDLQKRADDFLPSDMQEYLQHNDAGDESADVPDNDQKLSCEKWHVDERVFVPPTDVTFVDMNAMMQQAQKEMQQAQKEMQQAQKNAAGEMKDACKGLTGKEKSACDNAMKMLQ